MANSSKGWGMGSTGFHLFERLHALTLQFQRAPEHMQSSGTWMNWWADIDNQAPPESLPSQHRIGGGEPNSADGAFDYMRRIHRSSVSASSVVRYDGTGSPLPAQPDAAFREFETYLSLPPHGAVSTAIAKRVYNALQANPDKEAFELVLVHAASEVKGTGTTTWSS